MSTKYFRALATVICIIEYKIRVVAASSITPDGRNDLVKLLGHLDRSDELTAKLPTISAFMELNNDRRATTTSESNRRRGGHPACECPEESDTFSVSCYDRRLSLISTDVLKGQEIERNMTQLRSRHISLKASVAAIEDRINRMSTTLYRGNGPQAGLVDDTNAQMDVLRRVSDALTTCISSIWVQEFEVTAMNEEEFQRLNKVVGNATEAVLKWFTDMQALEESMTFQNLNLIVAYARAGFNESVGYINDAVAKTYNALKALDGEFGSSFTGVDKLQKELEAAGDLLQDKVEESIRSAAAAISDVKSEIESEVQTRITSELVKKGNQLIQSMQSVAAKKISQAGVASHDDIREQSNATLQDLLPRATKESLSIVNSVANVSHNYDTAVRKLKDKLDAKLESVLKNNTEWAMNATGGSRRTFVDRLTRFAEIKVSDIQAWISNRDQTELNIKNKIESLNSRVQTELTNAINSIVDQKMSRSLADASKEMDSRLNELDSDIHAKTSELYRVYHGGLDQFASIGHVASSGAVDTTGNLRQISTSSSGMLSSASDRVMTDQSALLKSLLGSVNDNIGFPLSQAAPLYPSRINAALRDSQSNANDQVSLYTSKAAAAGTLAASNSDNTVKSFLQNVSSVGDSALSTQRTITSLIGQQTAYLSQSSAPMTAESAMRRDMAAAAVRLAESEDGASMYLGKIAQNIPNQISMHPVGMQSAFTAGIDSVDHVRGHLNDATDQHRLGMVSSMSALSESSQRVDDLGRRFDGVSANRLGEQDAAVPRGLGEVYRMGQSQAMDISRVAQSQIRRIDSVMQNFGQGLDSDAVDTMKTFRSQVGHEVSYAKMIKKFLDAASPDMAKAAAELVTHRRKTDGFVNQTWTDIKDTVRLAQGNTSDIWRVLLDEFVERSKRHNKTSFEQLNVIESQALNLIDQIILGTNQTIEKVFDAFAHGEDVTKFHLSNIAAAATNVSYESNQNQTQTELSATNNISSVYDGLHQLLDDRSLVLRARIGNDTRPAIPYQASLDQLASRRNARETSQKLISKQRDVVQTTLDKEIAAINSNLSELAMNRTRASAKERLETVAMGSEMGSTKQFISELLGDSDSVVGDYRDVVEKQKRANRMTAETLFDQVAAVRSKSSEALGRMTEHLSANRQEVISQHSTDPKIMAGIIRSQVVGMSKVLDVFSRGAGSEGLLKSALQTTEDAGATFLHQAEARNADMEQQLSQNAHSAETMISDIQDETTSFMDSLNDIDRQASSLGTGLDSWSRSIGESVGNATLVLNNMNTAAPNISAMLNASIKSLVSSIESSLGRSMTLSNWLKLNNSLDAYVSKLNLTVTENTTSV